MKQAPTNRKAILVIGMHRSGTSALTRGLDVLGVNLGNRLRSPRIENQKGFWEDLDFNAINTDVLQSVGIEWHTPDRIDPTALRSSKLQPLMDRATAFLEQKFATTGLIGLKDPRASRVLPFWDEVFERSGVTVGYVIACRNPMSVAKSLSTRDGFPAIEGHVLWLEYMLCSLVYSAQRPRIVVDYDNMLEQPGKELTRIATALDLHFDRNGSQFKEYNTKFLSDSLRSTTFKIEDLNKCNTTPSISKDLYSLITDIAYDRINLDDQDCNNEISKLDILFSRNIDFFKNIIDESDHLKDSLQKISILEDENLQLNEEIKVHSNKNVLTYFHFKLKKIILKLRSAEKIHSLQHKLFRHIHSARLILINTKSMSSLCSLYHEIVALLKNHIFRSNKEKQTNYHDGSK